MNKLIIRMSLVVFLLSINLAGAQNIDNNMAVMRGSSNARGENTEKLPQVDRETSNRGDTQMSTSDSTGPELPTRARERIGDINENTKKDQPEHSGVDGRELTRELQEEAQNLDRVGSGNIVERAQQLRERVMEKTQTNRNQNAEQASQRAEMARERVEERQAEFLILREKMLENQNARKAELTEDRKTRVRGLVDNMLSRFIDTTGRLSDIVARLENRITEMEQSGQDVQNATLTLEGVVLRIENIITEIEAVDIELDEALEGEISAEHIRTVISNITDSIRASHGSLKSVIVEISN